MLGFWFMVGSALYRLAKRLAVAIFIPLVDGNGIGCSVVELFGWLIMGVSDNDLYLIFYPFFFLFASLIIDGSHHLIDFLFPIFSIRILQVLLLGRMVIGDKNSVWNDLWAQVWRTPPIIKYELLLKFFLLGIRFIWKTCIDLYYYLNLFFSGMWKFLWFIELRKVMMLDWSVTHPW